MTGAGSRLDPGFVGRTDEVARLTAALELAVEGRSAPLCLVLGEAGIGKSRLVMRVAAEARSLDLDVAWTEAEEGAGPFSALAGLRSRSEDLPRSDDTRWDRLDGVADAIAVRAPVLVIVEDLHWADDSSVWVVERLGRRLQGVAAPLLVTARSDEPGRDRLAGLVASADHVVRLGGMSVAETTRLAELAAPGREVDGPALWERTGGVPLFVREAAVLGVEGGAPEVAAGLLGRRVQRLGPGPARVLAGLAVAPPPAPRWSCSPGPWAARSRTSSRRSTTPAPPTWWSTTLPVGCGSATPCWPRPPRTACPWTGVAPCGSLWPRRSTRRTPLPNGSTPPVNGCSRCPRETSRPPPGPHSTPWSASGRPARRVPPPRSPASRRAADLAAAALGRLELYAHLVSDPHWRFSAAVRRAYLTCLRGDRPGAVRQMSDAARAAEGWLHPGEILGIEMCFRASAAFLHGESDPDLADQYDRNVALVGTVPAPFIQAGLAFAAWVLGREERARDHLGRAAPGVEVIATGLEALFALQMCGLAAAGTGDVALAGALRTLLEPFADRLGAGGAFVVPVASVLGLLCDLLGQAGAAERHHRTAATTAQRAGSPVLAARCRALAGRSGRPELPVTVAARGATIVRQHGRWVFTSPFGVATVPESAGVVQLAEVLRANGREVAAVDLAGPGGHPAAVVQHDLGPALDGRAKREYRARIAELRQEVDEADDLHDPDRAARARWELDALLEEIGRAVGIAGRDRPQGATDERARVNVTRSIRRAIGAVAAAAPDLGAHLDVSVRTGRHCRYQPDPATALTWEVVGT